VAEILGSGGALASLVSHHVRLGVCSVSSGSGAQTCQCNVHVASETCTSLTQPVVALLCSTIWLPGPA
jgi:hypothetical protein